VIFYWTPSHFWVACQRADISPGFSPDNTLTLGLHYTYPFELSQYPEASTPALTVMGI